MIKKPKISILVGLTSLSVLLLLVLFRGKVFDRDQQQTIPVPASSVSDRNRQKTLYLGFVPQGNAVFMVRKWQPLADYLSAQLQMPVEMVFRSTYQEIITALVNAEIDICFTGAYMYILATEEADIRPLVRRKKFGTSSYSGIIIVRKNNHINAIEDLKGRSFAFASKRSTSGYLLPIAMMKQRGIADPESYFSKVIHIETHDSALLAVHTGNVDGAAISVTRWRPDKKEIKDLKIIWKSEPLYLGPVSVRGSLDKGLREAIKQAMLRIGRTEETIPLSRHIQIEGFEEAFDNDYDIVRRAKKWLY